jgi:hypothetical protein
MIRPLPLVPIQSESVSEKKTEKKRKGKQSHAQGLASL